MAEMDISEEETPSSALTQTPYSAALRGESGDYEQFPPLDDEQIVNTALILFLQGVCLRAQGLENAHWTLQRKSFNFEKKIRGQHDETVRLFQARTDGHLRINIDGKSRSLAILEVKASVRAEAKPFMQESAQMAAWISAEPDVRNKSDTYR